MSNTIPFGENSPPLVAEEPTIVDRERIWTDSKLGFTAASGAVVLEVAPTNELARVAVIGGAIAGFHDPAITAAVAGASTMLIEGAGAVITADLLASQNIDKFLTWMRGTKKGESLLKYTEKVTSLPVESFVGITAGAPAAMILRRSREPVLTRQENRVYGLLMSLGSSALVAAGTYGAQTGYDVFGPEKTGAAAAAVAFGYSAYRWVRGRLSHRSNSEYEQTKTDEL
ncbi:MAG: hypothetical protein WDN66_00270 [Candidatus Saccharibacteria bacterium]